MFRRHPQLLYSSTSKPSTKALLSQHGAGGARREATRMEAIPNVQPHFAALLEVFGSPQLRAKIKDIFLQMSEELQQTCHR
jgi:hypothetical protein